MELVYDLNPSAAQMANLSSLISALETVVPAAEVTKNAYDGAISLHWPCYEVATYDDRFETYRLGEGETAIKHWHHAPGKAMASELLSEVSAAAS